MKVDDFIKDLATNLSPYNIDRYKQQAMAFVLQNKTTISGEEVANLINVYADYSSISNLFPDTKSMLKNIEIMMTETPYALQSIAVMFEKHPEIYKTLNDASKKLLFSKPLHDYSKLSTAMFKDLMEFDDQLWTEINMTNHLGAILTHSGTKQQITSIVNNKRFKSFRSHYKLRDLMIDHTDLIVNEKIFDKVFKRQLGILSESSGWNTDFVKELAPIIKNKFFKPEHFLLLTVDQSEGMRDFAKKNLEIIPLEVREILYNKFEDEEFISDEAKDMFIF